MKNNSTTISLDDMLKFLEPFGDVELKYKYYSWVCFIIKDGKLMYESQCYTHPHYATKECYDTLVLGVHK